MWVTYGCMCAHVHVKVLCVLAILSMSGVLRALCNVCVSELLCQACFEDILTTVVRTPPKSSAVTRG